MATLTMESAYNANDRVVYTDDVAYARRQRTIAGLEGTVIKVEFAEGQSSNFVRWDTTDDVEYEWYPDHMLTASSDVLGNK